MCLLLAELQIKSLNLPVKLPKVCKNPNYANYVCLHLYKILRMNKIQEYINVVQELHINYTELRFCPISISRTTKLRTPYF